MADEKEFHCVQCEFTNKYHYYGKTPPFAKSIVLLEDTFVLKDPFSSEGGLIVLGSHCSMCQASVCASQSCSLFYTKRFCINCVSEHLEEFPTEIQQETTKQMEQKS